MTTDVFIVNLTGKIYVEKLLISVLRQCPYSLRQEFGDSLTILDYDGDCVYIKKGYAASSEDDDDFFIRTWDFWETGNNPIKTHVRWTLVKIVGNHGEPMINGQSVLTN